MYSGKKDLLLAFAQWHGVIISEILRKGGCGGEAPHLKGGLGAKTPSLEYILLSKPITSDFLSNYAFPHIITILSKIMEECCNSLSVKKK